MKLMNVNRLCFTAALLLLIVTQACKAEGPASKLRGSKPNIIFILSDDLSYKDLSCYGQKHYTTPNLDKLATSAIRFNQAYAGSPECAPSRGSLMTGMHMGHCRIRKNKSLRGQEHLWDEDITIAEVLKQSGYATAFVGKWGIGLPGTEGVPDKQGFDLSYGFYNQSRGHCFFPEYMMQDGEPVWLEENFGYDMKRTALYNRSPVETCMEFANKYDDKGIHLPAGVADPYKASYTENLFIEKALGFINENKESPFFLYYATQLPHGPVVTPDLSEFMDKPWPQKNREWAAMVKHLDTNVGIMVEQLKELGIYDNTIIIFAGDNGYSAWGYFGRQGWEDDPIFKNKGPWRAGKFIAQEGGLRVPFFVHYPKHIPARESEYVCALYDVLPTLADMAGVTLNHKVDGLSLVAELENRPHDQPQHDYLYWESGSRNQDGQAVRLGKWKAYREHPSKPIELYDIVNDVASENNVASQHPDIIKKMEEIIAEAHADGGYYPNPGETKAESLAKKKNFPPMGDVKYRRGE